MHLQNTKATHFVKPDMHISCMAYDECVVIFQLIRLGDKIASYLQFQHPCYYMAEITASDSLQAKGH